MHGLQPLQTPSTYLANPTFDLKAIFRPIVVVFSLLAYHSQLLIVFGRRVGFGTGFTH